MKSLLGRCRLKLKLIVLAALWLARGSASGAGDAPNAASPESFDYAKPALLTGTVFATGSNRTNVLFTFRRSATRAGATVRVERQFDLPDGSVAAVEHIVYESGRLVSYEMRDLQANLWGTIRIQTDPQNPDRRKIFINHGHGTVVQGRGAGENLPKNTLIDDTIYPFILAHWDELMRGATVRFQMVSLGWERTFAFKLRKFRESEAAGQPVVWLKMTPASLIVSRFIKPIYFSLEINDRHRLLEYIGRTTPRIRKGKSWKPLDADTVFNWK